jgi:hypothetical protein
MAGAAAIAAQRAKVLHRPGSSADLAFALSLFTWWRYKPDVDPATERTLQTVRQQLFKGIAQRDMGKWETSPFAPVVPRSTLLLSEAELHAKLPRRIGDILKLRDAAGSVRPSRVRQLRTAVAAVADALSLDRLVGRLEDLDKRIADLVDLLGGLVPAPAGTPGGRLRKAAARKTTARKGTARKGTARKGTARKGTARKGTARKTTARTTTARKTTARKPAAARKTTARKTTARKPAAARKPTARKPVTRRRVVRRPMSGPSAAPAAPTGM